MIRVGIIGMGRSGWELHAAPLAQMEGFCVTGVCDQSEKRLAEAAKLFGAKPFTDPKALCGEAEVDLVVVSVPGSLHSTLAIHALECGKHVLVEKPMANTLAECDAMLAAAEKNQRLLSVFHNRYWDRDFRMVQGFKAAGVFGDLLSVEARVMTYGPEWANYGVPEFNSTWRTQAAYGGGFLADWGPHLVAQCLDLAGAWPTQVTCHLRSQMWATEVDDAFYLRLTFDSGLLVTIEGSNNARIPLPRWFIVGQEGTLRAEGAWGRWTEMQVRRTMGGMVVDVAPLDIESATAGKSMAVGEDLSVQFYTDLQRALADGAKPTITGEFARDIIAVLEAARQSHETGNTVALAAPREIGEIGDSGNTVYLSNMVLA